MPRPQQDRDELLDKLSDVFVQHGYDGASIATLAAATGLSKASLYHHFPDGKSEIAAASLRRGLADLNAHCFKGLDPDAPAADSLGRVIDGFSRYVDGGTRRCVVCALADHGDIARLVPTQMDSWTALLAQVFVGAGLKKKAAKREAQQLLATLYGALTISQLRQDAGAFQSLLKRTRRVYLKRFD